MASKLFLPGLKRILDAGFDTVKTNLRMMLLHDGTPYTFDQTHQYVSSVVGSEIVHASYARKQGNGTDFQAATQQDNANSRIEVVITGPTVVWATLAAGFNIDAVVLYEHLGADSANRLIAFWDQDPVLPTNGQNLTVTFDASEGNIRVSSV